MNAINSEATRQIKVSVIRNKTIKKKQNKKKQKKKKKDVFSSGKRKLGKSVPNSK